MDALAQAFGRHLSAERGLSVNTRLAYSGDVSSYLSYCAGRKSDAVLADAHFVEEYLWTLKEKGLKGATIFRKTEALKAFYRFLQLEGRVGENPTANFRSPRLAQRVPKYISGQDMQKLLSVHPGGAFSSLRTAAAMELLYGTGMRISELLGLRLEAVNFQQGWLRVFGKGAKERVVPVNGAALLRLKEYLSARDLKFAARPAAPEIFVGRTGARLSRVQMWKDLVALGRKAGVDLKPHPHLFRHTFASHMVQAGADLRSIQEMLGHASLNTTQIYTHIDKENIKRAHQKYHPDK